MAGLYCVKSPRAVFTLVANLCNYYHNYYDNYKTMIIFAKSLAYGNKK